MRPYVAAFGAAAVLTIMPAGATQRSDVTLPAVPERWTATIDSRYVADRWLARDESSIYVLRDGKVEAIDSHTGRVRWHGSLKSDAPPALAGDTVYVYAGARIVAFASRSGLMRRSTRVEGQTSIVGASSGAVAFSSNGPAAVVARGFGADGHVRWTRHLSIPTRSDEAPYSASLGGDAVGVRQSDAGVLIIDARDGRAVAATSGVDVRIGADGRYLWFSVVNGGIKGLDLATNRSIVLHGSIVRGAAKVEHEIAVAVVDGRLHRIDLRSGTDTILHIDGRWIGGPANGRIFIERGDGLYTMSVNGGKAVRAVAYRGETRYLTTDRHTAYATLEGGRLFVIDLTRGRAVAQLETGCDATEGVSTSDSITLIDCDRAQTATLIAFDRYGF